MQLKTSIPLVSLLAASAFVMPLRPAFGLTLASQGEAKAVIVLGPDATKAERYAAAELASYLHQATGAQFSVTDQPSDGMSRILVGQTAEAKKTLKKVDWPALRRDGIVVKTVGNDLVLAGDRPRGSLYAVYSFLEDHLDVRWWTPEAETVPLKPEFKIGKLNTEYKPPFWYREAFFNRVMGAPNAVFAARMRLNGHFQGIPPEMGGHYTILGWCHTFYQLLPPNTYFKDHPEWYSEINGKRVYDGAQLCLTNPQMKQELVTQALAWIKKEPNAGMISISQNDWGGPCQCENCKVLVKQTGSESGALITFVNSVAQEIERQYPDFLVETLAYTYTRHAPANVRPRGNVVVRLCSIEGDFGRPLTDGANRSFYEDLQNWKQVSNHLYAWDYVVNFSNLIIPHPNFQVLGDNVRTFADNNVVGLFEQGDGYNPDAAFAAMKTWVLAKLMWNPKLSERKLINEFLNGYYGDAAPSLARYIQILESVITRGKNPLGCFISNPTFYSASDLLAANAAMEKAEASVSGDPVLAKRVRVQRLALDHLLIISKRALAISEVKTSGIVWSTIADRYLKLSDETGNVFIGEGNQMPAEYVEMLKSTARTPL